MKEKLPLGSCVHIYLAQSCLVASQVYIVLLELDLCLMSSLKMRICDGTPDDIGSIYLGIVSKSQNEGQV